MQRARVAHAQKEDDRAALVAREAERLAPADAAVKVELGGLAADRHEYDEAERIVKAAFALPIGPGTAGRGYAALRGVYLSRGDVKAASTTYERQIELSPASAWQKGNYAKFLAGHGEHERAIAMAREALATMDYGVGHQILAEALAAKGVAALWDDGRHSAAKAAFDAALAEEPRSAPALYGRGAYYRVVALDEKDPQLASLARRDFAAALEVDPKLTLARDALAEHPRVEAEIAKKKKK